MADAASQPHENRACFSVAASNCQCRARPICRGTTRPLSKTVFRRLANRVLHRLARCLPGATGLRPALHRLRGVSVGANVFIADDVYLDDEYPEAVEIHDGAQISVRAIIIAHTRGTGKVVIGKDAYIGPNSVVITSGGRLLTIGDGAVIGAGVVVNNSIAPRTFVASAAPQAV